MFYEKKRYIKKRNLSDVGEIRCRKLARNLYYKGQKIRIGRGYNHEVDGEEIFLGLGTMGWQTTKRVGLWDGLLVRCTRLYTFDRGLFWERKEVKRSKTKKKDVGSDLTV